MLGRRVRLLLCLLAASSAACQALFGVDEPADVEDDETGSGASGGGVGAHGGQAADGAGATGAGPGAGGCGVCVETPAGWEGPAWLVTTAPGEGITCPNLVVDSNVLYEAEPPPHGCSPCSCGGAVAQCTDPLLTCYDQSGCAGAVTFSTVADGCIPFLSGTQPSCKVGNSTTTGTPGCPASGGNVEGQGWQLAHHLCALEAVEGECSGGACFSGDVTEGELCIVSAALQHVPCPMGWEQKVVNAWSSVADTRDCDCSCGPATGQCAGGYEFLAGFSCDVAAGLGQCKNNVGAANFVGANYTGSCQANAPVVKGKFDPQEPRTVCCRSFP